MVSLNIVDIKKRFPDFLKRVEAGEELLLEKSGKPIAWIVPIRKIKKRRELGKEKGRIWMSDDFTGPLPPSMC